MKFWKIRNKAIALLRRRTADFIIVGGTRSGSTTLHFMLKQHPEIFMTRRQELQYFNRDSRFRENLNGYTEHFALASNRQMAGEVTPMYIHKGYVYDRKDVLHNGCADDAITRIARLLPDTRIVVSLRDPVSRMISEYCKNRNQGKFDMTLAELLVAEREEKVAFGPVHSNRYDIHLEHIFAHFPREQVHVMIFEEWTKQLPDSLIELQRFLGVTPSDQLVPPQGLERNSADKYRKDGETPKLRPGDERLTDEQLADVREKLKPAVTYVENYLGRDLPWQ